MTRRVDNAFTRNWLASPATGADADRRPQGAERALRGSTIGGRLQFPSLRATCTRLADEVPAVEDEPTARWSLQLSPMRLIDAMPTWCGSGERAATVLLNPRYSALAGRMPPASLPALCKSTCASFDGRTAAPEWLLVADDCVVLDDAALMRLALDGRLLGGTLVRVEGEIEAGDARAILESLRAGQPAWQADFRVTSVLEAADDRSLALVTSSEALPLMLVGENLRQYVAAVLDIDIDTIGWVLPEQVHRLLSASGSILVRAIETDVFSTFVDVGVCISGDEDAPAGESLIYDLPSGSWHGE